MTDLRLPKCFRYYLLFITLQGIASLVCYFISPSEKVNAVILGLSLPRLILFLLHALIILSFLVLTLLSLTSTLFYKKTIIWLEDRIPLRSKTNQLVTFFVVSGLLLLLLFFWLNRPAFDQTEYLSETYSILLPNLLAYIKRLQPFLIWIALTLVEAGLMLMIVFWETIKAMRKKDIIDILVITLVTASIFAFIFQSIVLVFQIRIFQKIPGWYWPISVKPDLFKHGFLFALLLLFTFVILIIIKKLPRAAILYISLIFLLFIGLQYVIGYLEGRGLASLTDRFFLSYHRIYIEHACNSGLPAYQEVVNYEGMYKNIFFKTKPPGVLWMAYLTRNITNIPALIPFFDQFVNGLSLSIFIPTMDSPSCQRIMVLVTLFFPIIAGTVVWGIYAFSKWLFSGNDQGTLSAYSAIFFVTAPNVVMLSLFNDQVFYPVMFLLTIGGIIYFIKHDHWIGSLCMGALLYAVFFLSFHMLPITIVPILYFACLRWQRKRDNAFWKHFIRTLMPMGMGVIISLLIFKVFLGFDIFSRMQNMLITRIRGDFYTRLGIMTMEEATLSTKVRQIVDAAFLNNVELAFAVGFPFFILFIVMGILSVTHVIRRRASDPDAPVNATLFLTYLALNALRVVLGEVGRLYIFWMPVIYLLAMQFLLPILKRKWWLVFILVTMQFTTLFLTYQFQDFVMPFDVP